MLRYNVTTCMVLSKDGHFLCKAVISYVKRDYVTLTHSLRLPEINVYNVRSSIIGTG